MPNSKQLTTCLSLGLLITGCKESAIDHGKNKDQSAQVEPSLTQRDPKITAQVKKDVGEILGVSASQIQDSDRFLSDLGADSLDTVEIVMATEDAFDILIADEDAERITTVGELIDYVHEKIKMKKTAS